jgi:ATP-dependent Zn protease
MTKSDAKKIAEAYVNQHKDRYKSVAKKDIKQAVEKVAKALEGLESRAIKEPSEKSKASTA